MTIVNVQCFVHSILFICFVYLFYFLFTLIFIIKETLQGIRSKFETLKTVSARIVHLCHGDPSRVLVINFATAKGLIRPRNETLLFIILIIVLRLLYRISFIL